MAWYDSAEIDEEDLVAVYTAKGAATLAAALQNVLSPGTHDLTAPAAATITDDGIYIPLDTGGNARGRLVTDVTFDLGTTTLFMCYRNLLKPRSLLIGVGSGSAPLVYIHGDYVNYGNATCAYGTSVATNVKGFHATGSVALAANKYYFDGHLANEFTATTGTTTITLRFMGARSDINYEGPGGTFQYGLIANTQLTDEQILALHNATMSDWPASTFYVGVL